MRRVLHSTSIRVPHGARAPSTHGGKVMAWTAQDCTKNPDVLNQVIKALFKGCLTSVFLTVKAKVG